MTCGFISGIIAPPPSGSGMKCIVQKAPTIYLAQGVLSINHGIYLSAICTVVPLEGVVGGCGGEGCYQ